MALESPVDDYWMGGIIDKYFKTTKQSLLGDLDESRAKVLVVFTSHVFLFYFLPAVSAGLLPFATRDGTFS